jgi:myosin heavy chain 9/10/11/14
MASHFLERVRVNAVNDALVQANWAEKKLVWVADKKEGYLQGSIVRENGEEVEVLMEDQTVFCFYRRNEL